MQFTNLTFTSAPIRPICSPKAGLSSRLTGFSNSNSSGQTNGSVESFDPVNVAMEQEKKDIRKWLSRLQTQNRFQALVNDFQRTTIEGMNEPRELTE